MDDDKSRVNNASPKAKGASESASTPSPADRADRNPEYTGQFLANELQKALSKLRFAEDLTKRDSVIL